MVASTVIGLAARFVVRRSEEFQLDIDLTIPPGKTVALLGPNGAGKSTALSAIAGLVPIESGHVELNGITFEAPARGVFLPPEQRHVGVVFQDRLLFPHLSVLENVAFGLRSRGLARAEAAARSRQWLKRLDILELSDHRPAQLSGGQAQSVALARALVAEPKLLLLDEPMAALDLTIRGELRHVLRMHLDSFDGPRLLITHDPTEAFLLADQIHIVEGGAVTQRGTADEIRLSPRTQYAADLAGFNLVEGDAERGRVRAGEATLHIADPAVSGRVLLTIHPTAIAVHRARPGGSPRNAWETMVERVEVLGQRARLRTGAPLPVTVEVTAAALRELELIAGSRVWIAVKATEIRTQPSGE